MTLQVEDPANCWGLTPDRYDKLGKYYSTCIKDKGRLVFDCNVVACHEKGFGGLPAEKPSGEEIRQIVYNMSLSGTRPAFYSEEAFFPGDFKNISMVLARKTKITKTDNHSCKIISPYSVTINTGIKDSQIFLDDKEWHATNQGNVIIPVGEHFLSVRSKKRNENDFCMKSISGDLLVADFTGDSIDFFIQRIV